MNSPSANHAFRRDVELGLHEFRGEEATLELLEPFPGFREGGSRARAGAEQHADGGARKAIHCGHIVAWEK